MEKIKDVRDLRVWSTSIELVEIIYEITKQFPKEENYGLISQLRRAVVSIPSNIAEGFGRIHNKEYKQFLYISRGSCSELLTQVEISHKLEYINKETYNFVSEKIDYISRMLKNLIKCL